MNEQVTKVKSLLVERHTLSFNDFNFIVLDYLTWCILYSDLPAIKMFHSELNSSESLNQGNLLLHYQISTLPHKALMGNQLDLDNDISSFNIRDFITFSMDHVLLSIGCTFINLNFECLLLLFHFLTIASLALLGGVNLLSLTIAFITRS